MSFKSKMLAAAATLTLVGGAAGTLAAGPANAATPSCGHRCVNVFSKKFSDVLTTKPGFVLDVLRQGAKVGQPIIMFQSSNSDPAEDFTVSLQGTVSDFVAAGLVSPALALHYGTRPSRGSSSTRRTAWTAACASVSRARPSTTRRSAFSRAACRPRPCGSRTSRTSSVAACSRSRYVPLINGADTNFSHPFVLTYPQNANPNDKPRAQLVTQTLHQFSRGQVYDNQQWSAFFGVLR